MKIASTSGSLRLENKISKQGCDGGVGGCGHKLPNIS